MLEDFYDHEPYDLYKEEKDEMLTGELISLVEHHRNNCIEYSRFLDAIGYNRNNVKHASDIPFFPVRLFKLMDLRSITEEDIFKTMTSSGTSGQRVSKIFVDKETAMIQQKVMLKILGDHWGKKRLPMLVIDSIETVKNRKIFSARGAAIMGLQAAARDIVYALNDDMTINVTAVREFLDKYNGQKMIIFGFTFMVWEHFFKEADKINGYNLSEAVLMTGGGWKKLVNDSISQDEFKERLREKFGIGRFLDHYAMVEQTGCILAECEYGHLHASNYSDVFIRDPIDFSLVPDGKKGIIQTISVLAHSYPGHSLLTEDEGIIMGEDDCPCGRKGKYVRILGRLKSAELRGCSDTYADKNFKWN